MIIIYFVLIIGIGFFNLKSLEENVFSEVIILEINAIDLFCGVGGLTKGLINSGINVVAGIDIEEKCRYPYEINNNAKFIRADIKEITSEEVAQLYPKSTTVRLLAGCAPCQPFSSYSYRYKGSKNTKNKMDLLAHYGRLVKDIQPEIVTMENVPQMIKESVFSDFVSLLESLNYKVNWHIVNAPDYGVPQSRKRLVLIASRLVEIDIIPPIYDIENYPTVRDYIGELPSINSGEHSKYDPLHKSVKLSDVNMERIKQSKPGGTWRDWDESIILACHKKATGKSYTSVYGRMEWDKPAPTITTKFYGYGNGRFGHPEQNRAITFREGASLQTFPVDYKFIDDEHFMSTKELGILIGNAVPVKLAEAIGSSIIQGIS